MDLRELTALVTGADGTVGSVVARRLAREGCRVRALVRRAGPSTVGEAVQADLVDRDALFAAALGAHLVVHTAAERSGDIERCKRGNVEGVQNLVEALVHGGCRLLVHISTISVYDDAAGPDFDEDSPLWSAPSNAYGFTKAESERIVRRAQSSGLPSVVLRPACVLSMHPRSRWGPLAIEQARATSDSILPFPELPYVHVDNLADAVVLAARTPAARGRAYNVIDGVRDMTEYLAGVYGALARPVPPVTSDEPRVRYRAERIRRELGWTPADRWTEFITALRGHAQPR